jgi:hypothetical protein
MDSSLILMFRRLKFWKSQTIKFSKGFELSSLEDDLQAALDYCNVNDCQRVPHSTFRKIPSELRTVLLAQVSVDYMKDVYWVVDEALKERLTDFIALVEAERRGLGYAAKAAIST